MNATNPVALWVEPEPATRFERFIAVFSVSVIGVALTLSIGHLFLIMTGLVPIATAQWGFADIGLLYAEERWLESAVLALVVMSIVPFALPFASGIILLRSPPPSSRPARAAPRSSTLTAP